MFVETLQAPASPIVLSIIIPAYNESGKIAEAIRQLSDHVSDRRLSTEIIVVDDGSLDATVAEAEASPRGNAILRVLSNRVNRGKGYAIKCGVLESRGQLVLFSDADLSVPPRELDRFLVEMSKGTDIVIGSRRLRGSPLWRWLPGSTYESQIKVHQPFYREAMGEAYLRLISPFLGLGIRDFNCGFKCFRGDVARRIFRLATIDRWGFDAEVLLVARRLDCTIVELEVEWHNNPASKVNLLTAPLSSLAEVFRIKMNDLRGRYRAADDGKGAAEEPNLPV